MSLLLTKLNIVFGISFSGNCLGPKLLQQLEITIGKLKVLTYEVIK